MLVPLLSHAVNRSFTYDERAELFPLQVVLLVNLCVRLQSDLQQNMSVIAKQFLFKFLTCTC